MTLFEILAAVFGGFLVLLLLSFLLKVPTNTAEPGEEADDDADAPLDYDPAGPDPWEAELGETTPRRDVDTLIAVLRQGEPGPCRGAIAELVSYGEEALPALQAAAGEGDPDLKIDAERAIALIEEESGA